MLSFEAEHRQRRDPAYAGEPVDCYAARLRERFRTALAAAVPAPRSGTPGGPRVDPGTGVAAEPRADAEPPVDAEPREDTEPRVDAE